MQTAPTPRPKAGHPAIEVDLPGSADLLNSQQLLRGQKSVAIAHNGALYRLQTTRQGKLILTK